LVAASPRGAALCHGRGEWGDTIQKVYVAIPWNLVFSARFFGNALTRLRAGALRWAQSRPAPAGENAGRLLALLAASPPKGRGKHLEILSDHCLTALSQEEANILVTEIRHIGRHVGEEVTVQGWVYNLRESGKLLFPIFRDGTGLVQGVVVKSAVSAEIFERIRSLTQESSVQVTGRVRADQRAPGGFELDVTNLEVIQLIPPEQPYPISPKEHGIEFLMDHRHLWLRSSRQRAILGVRHEVIKASRDFLDDRGFTLVDTPIFTPSACEGTTSLFEVNYFDEKAYLTQSGQLYNEAAAAAVGKTYCFGPVFRAEKSKTRRHLTEFWMVEPEVAFARLEDICVLAEEFVAFVVDRVLTRSGAALKALGRDAAKLEPSRQLPFPRLSYDDAVSLLRSKGSEIEWGGDFGGADETILSSQFDRPVLVTGYPSAIKAFYMAPDPARPEVARCVDILAPEGYGEIVGGGERIADYNLLVERIDQHQLPHEAFEWYLDVRRYGAFPHSGFGMGIERVVGWLCGAEHVRETIPFPRMLYRLTP
jgi:asparaginyl-tRNA synthetase